MQDIYMQAVYIHLADFRLKTGVADSYELTQWINSQDSLLYVVYTCEYKTLNCGYTEVYNIIT